MASVFFTAGVTRPNPLSLVRCPCAAARTIEKTISAATTASTPAIRPMVSSLMGFSVSAFTRRAETTGSTANSSPGLILTSDPFIMLAP